MSDSYFWIHRQVEDDEEGLHWDKPIRKSISRFFRFCSEKSQELWITPLKTTCTVVHKRDTIRLISQDTNLEQIQNKGD